MKFSLMRLSITLTTLLTLSFLLLSTAAFAQKAEQNRSEKSADKPADKPTDKWADNWSNNLTSLNYYPHSGNFELNSHVVTSLEDKSQNSLGSISKDSYTQFYGSLVYGIVDRVRISLAETFLWDQIDDTTSSTSTESLTSSSGLSSPTISGAWRYLEDNSSGLSGDFTLSVLPSFGPKVTGSGAISKTGNNLSGGWAEELSTSLFWRNHHNQMEINAAATNNGTSTTDNPTGGVAQTATYVSSSVTLTDRYHFSAGKFLQASCGWLMDNHRSTTSAAGVLTKIESLGSAETSLLYGYSPDPGIVIEISASWHPSSSKATAAGVETTTQARLLTTTVALLHNF